MQLFWTKGYHATSLKDLETALEMKPGSIYAAFASKENLYLASLERYFVQGKSGLERTLRDATSPLEALANHLRSSAKTDPAAVPCRSCMLVRTVLDTTATDLFIAAQARTYLDAMKDIFEAGFARAKAESELPANADCAWLARRFQANLAALRIEIHRGTPQSDAMALAEDMATEVEALRR